MFTDLFFLIVDVLIRPMHVLIIAPESTPQHYTYRCLLNCYYSLTHLFTFHLITNRHTRGNNYSLFNLKDYIICLFESWKGGANGQAILKHHFLLYPHYQTFTSLKSTPKCSGFIIKWCESNLLNIWRIIRTVIKDMLCSSIFITCTDKTSLIYYWQKIVKCQNCFYKYFGFFLVHKLVSKACTRTRKTVKTDTKFSLK